MSCTCHLLPDGSRVSWLRQAVDAGHVRIACFACLSYLALHIFHILLCVVCCRARGECVACRRVIVLQALRSTFCRSQLVILLHPLIALPQSCGVSMVTVSPSILFIIDSSTILSDPPPQSCGVSMVYCCSAADPSSPDLGLVSAVPRDWERTFMQLQNSHTEAAGTGGNGGDDGGGGGGGGAPAPPGGGGAGPPGGNAPPGGSGSSGGGSGGTAPGQGGAGGGGGPAQVTPAAATGGGGSGGGGGVPAGPVAGGVVAGAAVLLALALYAWRRRCGKPDADVDGSASKGDGGGGGKGRQPISRRGTAHMALLPQHKTYDGGASTGATNSTVGPLPQHHPASGRVGVDRRLSRYVSALLPTRVRRSDTCFSITFGCNSGRSAYSSGSGVAHRDSITEPGFPGGGGGGGDKAHAGGAEAAAAGGGGGGGGHGYLVPSADGSPAAAALAAAERYGGNGAAFAVPLPPHLSIHVTTSEGERQGLGCACKLYFIIGVHSFTSLQFCFSVPATISSYLWK